MGTEREKIQMRKKNLWKTCLAVGLAVMTLSEPVYAANWVHNNTGWWWHEVNGSYPANQWKKINGTWYWFDGNGYMATGWRNINGKWYWFDASGAMTTGWRNINGTWYYLESSGAMASNKWIGNYYVESSGAMATSKWIGNYYVNETGVWTQTKRPAQWVVSGNRWWYRHSDGSYTKNGWETINGKDYLFDPAGWMLTGWQSVNGTWYYLESSGAKVANKWVGNYYVQADGTMATNKWVGDYYVNSSGLWVETKGQHHWNDGVVTTVPTCNITGVKTYTCTICGDTKIETLSIIDHNWSQFTWDKIKNGYGCNYCYNDVTDYENPYECHGGWHTHTFYQFPSYYICTTCNKMLHKHEWRYVKPVFKEGSDEISHKGYWKCWQCGNQSSDGIHMDAILVSEENHEYGSNDHWTTPYNFEKGNYEWIIEDTYWEPADDELNLQSIRLNKTIYSMSVGDSYQNSVTFSPANPIEGKNVTWESSDPSIVTVDDNGVFTALKNGEATISAKSSQCTDTCFIRVTNTNVGKVSSATLYINGQSDPVNAIRLPKGSYDMNVQTNPEQAVYTVEYKTEEQDNAGWISNITGYGVCGYISEESWGKGINYTDSSTTIDFLRNGSVILKAIITDVNGNEIELSQKVIVN